jgi:hypothetical protein
MMWSRSVALCRGLLHHLSFDGQASNGAATLRKFHDRLFYEYRSISTGKGIFYPSKERASHLLSVNNDINGGPKTPPATKGDDSGAWIGSVKGKFPPPPSLALAHNCPPCDSTMERHRLLRVCGTVFLCTLSQINSPRKENQSFIWFDVALRKRRSI